MKNEGTHHFAAMSEKKKKRGKYRGMYGAPTGKQLQVTDQSRVLPEDQVEGMINAVLAGHDVEEMVDATVGEIYEGQGGGPYPIGSTVSLNQSWVGMDVAGKPVSLSKGDTVSIVMPNLGEHGQDKMVLLADGATRTVVPLHVLGEQVDEGHSDGGYAGAGGDTTSPKRGPSGHKVPSTTGPVGGQKGVKFQGDPKPNDYPETRGAGKPSSHPSKPQGKGMPGDDPSAQMPGSKAPSSHSSVAVESFIGDKFSDMLDEADDPIIYRRISELARAVFDTDDEDLYAIVAESLSADSSVHLRDLEWLFLDEEGDDDDEFMKALPNTERKKFGAMSKAERKKYRKKHAYRMKYRKAFGEEVGEGEMPPELKKQMKGMKEKGKLKNKRGQYGCE
jgi:hypothetical protein